MKGDKIPDQHHVARYCQPKYISDEKIQAGAFMVRKDEESLSVNWLEFLNCSSKESQVAELQNIYSRTLKVRASSKIAVINVGEVREKVLAESLDRPNLEVLHDPQVDDPSHSGIYNLQQNDELIAELILETVREIFSARK